MDIITITTIDDKEMFQFPDISYDRFVDDPRLYKTGSSDVEYDKYMHKHNMAFITDINSEAMRDEIVLVIKNEYRNRVLKFKCIYDSDE